MMSDRFGKPSSSPYVKHLLCLMLTMTVVSDNSIGRGDNDFG